MSELINTAILRLSRRAESYDREHLVSTFVDAGPLFTMLSNPDHQILYGRRGTGKTHALSFLANHVESQGDIAIQIDMRTVGSSGGIYSDPSLPLSERATRLLIDTLAYLHDQLLTVVLTDERNFDLSLIGPILDRFADSIAQVSVVGTVVDEETRENKTSAQDGISIGYNSGLSLQLSSSDQNEESTQIKRVRTGTERFRLHFGTVRTHLSQIVSQIAPKRIWVLLDEWSEVPLDLQPYLADLLRRTLFTIQGTSVKIAAIEQRCEFRIEHDSGGYVGIELGADAANSLNLDEYMVFDNNSEQAKNFFSQLIYKHVSTFFEHTGQDIPHSPTDFIRQAFTQQNSFDEFVRAAEGVPRDAINILGLAAQAAQSHAISIPNIRGAAKNWYNRNKEQSVTAKIKALELLRWIIDEVIAHRRARAFLLRSDLRHELIDFLYDARILHLVKQGVSSHDLPGVRFNVYSIDYGCYVDLINTTRAPKGLFEVDTESGSEFVDVPANDYRAIRRAILDLNEFENRAS